MSINPADHIRGVCDSPRFAIDLQGIEVTIYFGDHRDSSRYEMGFYGNNS